MAANRIELRVQLLTLCVLSFAATRPVRAYDADCSIKLWKRHHERYQELAEYPCTPHLFGANIFTVQTLTLDTCYLNVTDPANACGPIDPAPFDDHNHVALVPTCVSGLNSGCSLEEKAKNLGQANYVAFITWDDYNCSSEFDLKTVSSDDLVAVPIAVEEEDGRQLLLYAGNPNYVVDIYIQYNDLITLAGLVMASGMLCCLCCCLLYIFLRLGCRSCCGRSTTSQQRHSLSRRALNRMAVKCTYKIGQGMNEMCSICLEEFTEGEQVRELPCLHVYHGGCAEKWLKEYKHTCPLCNTPITASRKKRVAVVSSERTPLLAAADLELSVSYGALQDKEKSQEDSDHSNTHVTTTATTAGTDAEVGGSYDAPQD